MPAALGKKGKAREAAVAALAHLRAAGHQAILEEVAKRYGAEAVEAFRGLWTKHVAAVETPRRSTFVDTGRLPRPRLASSGKEVSREALDAMLVLLATSPLETRRPELEESASELLAQLSSAAEGLPEGERAGPEVLEKAARRLSARTVSSRCVCIPGCCSRVGSAI